jgi:hypothetical protein
VAGLPHLIRTYPTPRGEVPASPDGHTWTILEAALAPIFSPAYLDSLPIIHNGAKHRFQDAGPFGFTSPSQLAYPEALCLFPGRRPNTFVSLGADLPKLLNLVDMSHGDPLRRYIEHLVKVVSDTERVHDALAGELQKR